jgi:cholesterol transport system auxiliary component
VVRIDAQIVDTASNRAVASRSFLLRQPAASKEVPDVVQALGQASDQLSRDMVDWAVQSLRGASTSH